MSIHSATRIDIITPETSTVGYVHDYNIGSLQDFDVSRTKRRRLQYVWTVIPPNARFCIDMSDK